jgi:chemotaxis response regulator CheB
MVAQHMPATFTGPFAKRLDRNCELRVVEVSHPMLLQAGTIYIARGDADLIVTQRSSGMNALSVPAQRDYPWHPSVERMVRSALENYDATRLLGVLMTGMGRDGADAMTQLHHGGGRTIAEAECQPPRYGACPGSSLNTAEPVDTAARRDRHGDRRIGGRRCRSLNAARPIPRRRRIRTTAW